MKDIKNSDPRGFKFNLIPPKTEDEIKLITERDNSVLYSVILIFSSVLTFFLLNILQLVLISPRIINTKNNIKSTEDQIEAKNEIRMLHGEMIMKANLLRPILEKDINLAYTIELSDLIISNQGEILTYDREDSGEIVLAVLVDDINAVIDIVTDAKENEELENVSIRRITAESKTSKYRLVLAYSFVAEV